ncbi:hypothetical protein [Nonomuraea lactucae]|uniref:hypothetical protein n=1 Tax=Nonomuraea lactucae TaxID=2249762 RepID=UPI000DE53621|nr:hypothetical protein [Nonomuraea lactucae]
MIYDPVEVAITFLKPRVPGVMVSGSLVGHAVNSRHLIVTLIGGTREVRHRLDRWRFDFDAYGPDKRSALQVALTARTALLEELPGRQVGPMIAAEVTEELGPSDISDPVSREQRFVFSHAIYLYGS